LSPEMAVSDWFYWDLASSKNVNPGCRKIDCLLSATQLQTEGQTKQQTKQ
jgi:hypothetical protein